MGDDHVNREVITTHLLKSRVGFYHDVGSEVVERDVTLQSSVEILDGVLRQNKITSEIAIRRLNKPMKI